MEDWKVIDNAIKGAIADLIATDEYTGDAVSSIDARQVTLLLERAKVQALISIAHNLEQANSNLEAIAHAAGYRG